MKDGIGNMMNTCLLTHLGYLPKGSIQEEVIFLSITCAHILTKCMDILLKEETIWTKEGVETSPWPMLMTNKTKGMEKEKRKMKITKMMKRKKNVMEMKI